MIEKAVPSSSPHILVADDERSIRLMLEAGLKLNGFQVTSVPTGSKALEVARKGGIDAVLSDIYMPDGGGLDLVRDLHQIDPTIPIILMTAQGSVEAAVRAMAEGATDFIGKPFDVAAVSNSCGVTWPHDGKPSRRRRHRALRTLFHVPGW